MSSVRRRYGLGISLAVAASTVLAVPLPAHANPAGTGLVINEVYGAGGNSGALYNADFVELYNPTAAPISLAGLGLQYRSAAGGSGGLAPLSGTVPAQSTFLIQVSSGANGAPIDADLTTSVALNMAAGSGQVLLLPTATAFSGSGDVAGNAGLIDMVGYGTGVNTFETAQTGAALTAATSAQRTDGADTDSNAADFTAKTPTPQPATGDTDPEEPGEPGEPGEVLPIATIQGTTAISPKNGQTVTTEGVVTAAYPTGGYNGFYLQTEGTGGATDATPGASDAIFVYGGAGLPAGAYPEVGDFVRVTGPVSEFQGTTEITVNAAGIVHPGGSPAAVTPLAAAYPTTEAEREAHEGELLAPTDDFVVTNSYTTNQYAEIGLATGGRPLVQPTVVGAPGSPAAADTAADNAERGVTLDDGASINFLSGANRNIAVPYLTGQDGQPVPVRVGAPVTFTQPVILEYRNSTWKLQPQHHYTAADAAPVEVADTREDAPATVPGDLHLATFNVLNYFNTTGVDFVAAGGSCTYYDDRQGNHVANNTCNPDGPRGAAEADDLARQQEKIVAAINELGADIVSLEEIENSIKLLGETDRDDALAALVTALNDAAGPGTWAFAPSPAAADLPAKAEQDVIRTAFIFKPARVSLVGASQVLTGSAPFANAREPLAQAFKPAGADDAEAFAVVVNHLKSKGNSTPPATGDNADTGNGAGAFNGDRTRQAQALATFADAFATSRGTDKVFLTGDFNSYDKESPMQALYDAGYTLVGSDTPDEWSYSFSGMSGSLDHVLANGPALEMVAGADIWGINSAESIAFEYSRHNYNLTDFHQAGPFRSSDHDPYIVGLRTAPAAGDTVDVNLLNINDFHGRIDANTTAFATTVEQLRAAAGEDSTLLLSAGDNIGASLFASSSVHDEPTIDVLNALGLRSSAVGNHEFDAGMADLTGRVRDRADWRYLGANVYHEGTQDPALPEYDTFEIDGVTVGVIGVVTQETPALVSPAGVADLDFGDPVEAVNRVAGRLSDGNPANGEADVIVAEYHEGAGANLPDTATCADEIAADTAFGTIARDTSADVDVIFTGHTHKTYACDGPVPGAPSRTRPIVQTGEYGGHIGQVQLEVDPETGDVVAYAQRNVDRVSAADLSFPRVQQVKQITDDALAAAAVLGNQEVATISADITTAFSGGTYTDGVYTGGSRDDRAAESTLGDLVAQALKDGVAQFAEPDLGITNPGGLRDELRYAGDTSGNPANTDGVVTYAEANAVLPFNNTVAIVQLTGAQLKEVLEQQWQTDADGNVPSRPYLQLGLSDNVRVTADPSKPQGSRITSVRIDGEPLDLQHTYTVSTLSFLATGGDNFRAFTEGSYVDTGLLDADLWRGYLDANSPVAPDFARQQVEESGLPATVAAGQEVSFDLAKLDLTSLGSPANTEVQVFLAQAGERLAVGTFAVTGGSAAVSFTAPADLTGDWEIGIEVAPSQTRIGAGGAAPAEPSVSGTVRDAAGQPLAGACVYLYADREAPSASYATCTGEDGTYWMAPAAGSYVVAVADPSGANGTTWLADPVQVDGAVTGVDVTMDALADARVTGTVSDATSAAPVGNVCVFAYPTGDADQAAYASCSQGDGGYGIYGMGADSYDLAYFDPAGTYETQWWTGTTGGAASQAGSVAVVLATGTSAAVADAAMSGVSTGSVSGQVSDGSGPVAGVCVYLYADPAGPAAYGTCTQADGTWWIGDVAPGVSYKVAFADPSAQLATQWWTGTTGGASSYATGETIPAITPGAATGGIDAEMTPVS